MKTRHGRVFILGAMVPSLIAALLCVWQPSRFIRLEHSVYDILVRAAGTRPHSGQILIVDVDDRSLAALGQWPWSRQMIANLLTEIRTLEAAVVALDVMFPEPDRHDDGIVTPDEALAGVLRKGGVLLGYGFTFDRVDATPASPSCLKHPASVAVLHRGADQAVEPFFRATTAVCNLPILAEAAEDSGFLNAAPDADGILRRVPLLLDVQRRHLSQPRPVRGCSGIRHAASDASAGERQHRGAVTVERHYRGIVDSTDSVGWQEQPAHALPWPQEDIPICVSG